MSNLAKKTHNFLNTKHQGAETFEVVVIVAIMVIIIIALWAIFGEALGERAGRISEDIANAGTDFNPGGGGA